MCMTCMWSLPRLQSARADFAKSSLLAKPHIFLSLEANLPSFQIFSSTCGLLLTVQKSSPMGHINPFRVSLCIH